MPDVSTIIAAAKVTGKNVDGLGIGVLSAVTGSIPVATRTPPTINGNDYRAAQCGSAVVSQGT